MKIVLYQPQIPQNTGNIVRSCSVTGTDLILVEPMGFSINDRWLKRAGLDYWDGVDVKIITNLVAFLEETNAPFYFFSSKATKSYDSINYPANSILIFGSETSGLPQEFFNRWPEQFAKIPMVDKSRCLNLATSAGIVLYEAHRQNQFNFIN